MIPFRFRSLKGAYYLLILPLLTCITLFGYTFLQKNRIRDSYLGLSEKLNRSLRIHSEVIAYPMWNLNERHIRSLLEDLLTDSDVVGLSVFDEKGRAVHSVGTLAGLSQSRLDGLKEGSSPARSERKNVWTHLLAALRFRPRRETIRVGSQSILFGGEDGEGYLIGSLYAAVSDVETFENIHREIRSLLGLFALILLLSSLSILLGYELTVGLPLMKLKETLLSLRASPETEPPALSRDRLNEIDAVNRLLTATWENRRQRQELEAEKGRLEAIGTLAGSIAHKFNNDLTAIYGNILLIREASELSSEAEAYWERTLDALDHATETANKFLTFSRGGAPRKEEVILPELLTPLLADYCGGLPREENFPPEFAQRPVRLDPRQIRTAVGYLLAYIRTAGREETPLRIGLERRPPEEAGRGEIRLTLAFTLKEAHCGENKELFRPFAEPNKPFAESNLAISKSILLKHGGELRFLREENNTGCFLLILPEEEPFTPPSVPAESDRSL